MKYCPAATINPEVTNALGNVRFPPGESINSRAVIELFQLVVHQDLVVCLDSRNIALIPPPVRPPAKAESINLSFLTRLKVTFSSSNAASPGSSLFDGIPVRWDTGIVEDAVELDEDEAAREFSRRASCRAI